MAKAILYGYHAVLTAAKLHPDNFIRILIQQNKQDERAETLINAAKSRSIATHQVSRDKLQELVGDAVHQGVVAELKSLPSYSQNDLDALIEADQNPLILVLDGIQDPHNLGACLRSANGLAVTAVIIPKDKAVGMTATVRKVACGAADVTPLITVTNLARTLKELQDKGIWLVGTSDKADNAISQIDLTGPIAIVMGGEQKGLRALTQKHCDFLAKIPMSGVVSSLNVSVATGICLYEANRQRLLS